MKKFLVVWRGDEAEFYQSLVETDVPEVLSESWDGWITEAAKSEGYNKKAINRLLEYGYELILVCDFPENFYY